GSLCFSATCSFLPSLFHALLLPSCPTRRSSDLGLALNRHMDMSPFLGINPCGYAEQPMTSLQLEGLNPSRSQVEQALVQALQERSEEHTSELQSRFDLVCRLLLEKTKDLASTHH